MSIEEIRRSIWHAFTALAKGEEGQVAKSRLKVLTNNIGHALGHEKAEEILEDADVDNLNFVAYYDIIQPKLLCCGDLGSLVAELPRITTEIDNICWMLCEATYLKSSSDSVTKPSILNNVDLKKLWKIFNFLAKIDLDNNDTISDEAVIPLRVDVEEGYRIGSLIRQAVGYSPSDIPVVDPTSDIITDELFCVDFEHFLNIITSTIQDLPIEAVQQGVSYVSEEILEDVIKKGYLEKFGNHVTHWKRRWFRLSAKSLQYFTTDKEQELKGMIEVKKAFRPESMSQHGGRAFRIKLYTSGKSYELATSDLRSKNEWMTAFQKAADVNCLIGSFQKHELLEREKQRKKRREKVYEDEFGKTMMREALQYRNKQLEEEQQGRLRERSMLRKREEELEKEKQARILVEARLAEEEAQLEAERQRLKELEEIKAMLERLLEEERQAKRDEEIVRALQARLLAEEMEKREELERLKAEQERLLKQERDEKAGLERDREEQAALLQNVQQHLKQLHEERQNAEEQMKAVEEKMRIAEAERRKMEDRLRLREMSTSDGMRRPLPTHNPDPFVTHRGKGAFTEADFVKKVCLDQVEESKTNIDMDRSSSLHKESESENNNEKTNDNVNAII